MVDCSVCNPSQLLAVRAAVDLGSEAPAVLVPKLLQFSHTHTHTHTHHVHCAHHKLQTPSPFSSTVSASLGVSAFPASPREAIYRSSGRPLRNSVPALSHLAVFPPGPFGCKGVQINVRIPDMKPGIMWTCTVRAATTKSIVRE